MKLNLFSSPSIACAVTLAFLVSCKNDSKNEQAEKKDDSTEIDSSYYKLPNEQKRLPENAVKGLKVAEGLEATLFASEPMLFNPANMDIDEKGRVWVTEGINYRAKKDTKKEGDRIVILQDNNGDGKADTAKVFYQGNDVNTALGICVLGNKVIVSCSPNVFLFTDTDGDDKADKKEIIFSHIEGVQHDHGMHTFSFGPDGKLYFNFGNSGMRLYNKAGKPVLDQYGQKIEANGKPYQQGMVFRCNPDGSQVEVLGHNFRNNYEVTVDSYGSMWQSDNDDDGNKGVRINYVMQYGNYGYTDEMTGAGWNAQRENMEDSIPLRHWHLNDPGAVPNLLQTGSGSPTGITVYEGTLLPERFRNQVIHSDAGPNVVRAYPVENNGAGYKASIENIVVGMDQWFRPSDVCVAPDGSLFIADWYDPVVGGHQMDDNDNAAKGRVFRVAPPKTAYKIPTLDLSSPEGAVTALQSPNIATRYLAYNKLKEYGNGGEEALLKLWKSSNDRYRARALWLLSKLNGKTDHYIQEAIKDKNADIRITGLRIAMESNIDPAQYVKALINDPSAQVKREAAIALRSSKSAEAPGLWADLAAQYDGKDRWYLEALGIGAEKQKDKFFDAWKGKVGENWKTPAGMNIIWRSRGKEALPMLASIIQDPSTPASEIPKYFRAFDFHTDPLKEKVLTDMLAKQGTSNKEVVFSILSHINPTNIKMTPVLTASIKSVAESLTNNDEYLFLANRIPLPNQTQRLLQIMYAKPDSSQGIEATKLLMRNDGPSLFKNLLNKQEDTVKLALRALGRLSYSGNTNAMELIESIIFDKKRTQAMRAFAVKSLGQGWSGEDRLFSLVKSKRLPKELTPAASHALFNVEYYRPEFRAQVLKYLELPGSAEGKPLPPINELAKMKGDVNIGEQMFTRSCAICHQINGKGVNFGPKLSEIGSKLPKEGIYSAIINPDAGISFGFEGVLFKMKDGSETIGIISSETEDEIEIRSPGGVSSKIDKKQVISRKVMENSLMPPNLQSGMTEKEFVSLVEYLSSLKKK